MWAAILKQVLKLASVVGRSFFYRVLHALAETDPDLDKWLAELQDVELIRERQRLPELEYIFKHALAQEATYASILVERRRQFHRRVAERIEELFGDRLEEFYGVRAHWSAPHFDCSPWGRKMRREVPWASTGGRQTADASSARSSSGQRSSGS